MEFLGLVIVFIIVNAITDSAIAGILAVIISSMAFGSSDIKDDIAEVILPTPIEVVVEATPPPAPVIIAPDHEGVYTDSPIVPPVPGFEAVGSAAVVITVNAHNNTLFENLNPSYMSSSTKSKKVMDIMGKDDKTFGCFNKSLMDNCTPYDDILFRREYDSSTVWGCPGETGTCYPVRGTL